MPKVYVVSKTRPELYQRLSMYFAGEDGIKVLLDRRHGERRKRAPAEPGRRQRDDAVALRSRGWIVVETALREAPSPVTAVLEAATPAADLALGGRRPVIQRFPYAIERGGDAQRSAQVFESRLTIPDREPFHVSRRHCVVVSEGGEVAVVDTTSRLGTVVNGELIGGGSGRLRAPLKPGDNHIAVGGPRTRYVFKLVLAGAPA
jgi:hypothetical protein